MTRDEFMKHAAEEIDEALCRQKNRMMNLVEQAWAEGKRNAEMDKIDEFAKGVVEHIKKSIIVPYEMKLPETTNTWELGYTVSNVLDACKQCSNNPANGGSGICHCILGTSPIT